MSIERDYRRLSKFHGKPFFKSVGEVLGEMYSVYGIIYEEDQVREIRYGIEDGLNILWYLEPAHDAARMRQIRLGLEDNLDVSVYAKPVFVSKQMKEIRLGMLEGVDVSLYANPRIPWDVMKVARESLRDGVDVSELIEMLPD